MACQTEVSASVPTLSHICLEQRLRESLAALAETLEDVLADAGYLSCYAEPDFDLTEHTDGKGVTTRCSVAMFTASGSAMCSLQVVLTAGPDKAWRVDATLSRDELPMFEPIVFWEATARPGLKIIDCESQAMQELPGLYGNWDAECPRQIEYFVASAREKTAH